MKFSNRAMFDGWCNKKLNLDIFHRTSQSGASSSQPRQKEGEERLRRDCKWKTLLRFFLLLGHYGICSRRLYRNSRIDKTVIEKGEIKKILSYKAFPCSYSIFLLIIA